MKSFREDVLRRFMTDGQYESLVKEYDANKRHSGGNVREVTRKDQDILDDYMKGMRLKELSHKHRVTMSAVNTAVRIAALSRLK